MEKIMILGNQVSLHVKVGKPPLLFSSLTAFGDEPSQYAKSYAEP